MQDVPEARILITDRFERVETTEPRQALDQAGADTQIVSPKDGQVKAWTFTELDDQIRWAKGTERPVCSRLEYGRALVGANSPFEIKSGRLGSLRSLAAC